jgi:hypothetical protein
VAPNTAKPKKVNGICHRRKLMCVWMNECALKITNHDKGAKIENHVVQINAI